MLGHTAVQKKSYNIVCGLCHRIARPGEEEGGVKVREAVVVMTICLALSSLVLCSDGQAAEGPACRGHSLNARSIEYASLK